MGSIIASHLVLVCKGNPAALAFAGFGHLRSAPHHSGEILTVGRRWSPTVQRVLMLHYRCCDIE